MVGMGVEEKRNIPVIIEIPFWCHFLPIFCATAFPISIHIAQLSSSSLRGGAGGGKGGVYYNSGRFLCHT